MLLLLLLQAIVSFVTMQFQLCTVFFTFSLGTRTHYFGRTILHGGARVCLLTWYFTLLFISALLLICIFVDSIKQLAVGLLSAILNFRRTTGSTLAVILWRGVDLLLSLSLSLCHNKYIILISSSSCGN